MGDARRRLGRGLSALLAEVSTEGARDGSGAATTGTSTGSAIIVPIEAVSANPHQPRKHFDEDQLRGLAASIGVHGIVQPLLVRRAPQGGYEIVAGERRWRAAQIARLHEVPVIVRDYNDAQVLEIALVENVQRTDLNPIEEASGYRRLLNEFGHTQEELATALGKSRSHISNMMRLLSLPGEVQGLLESGQLGAGHARALVPMDDPVPMARQAVAKGMSVRDVENLAKRAASQDASPLSPARKDADTRAIEADLAAELDMKVAIDYRARGGTVCIRYRTAGQLDALIAILSSGRLRGS